jgi:broad specificity phosphatase PhoE
MLTPLTLTLISSAATAATRAAAFARDEPITEAGRRKATALGRTLRRVDAALAGPTQRARQTAAAMGLAAEITADLADIDPGAWSGQSLEAIAAAWPAELAAWTGDPAAAPHGGESVEAMIARTAGFLRSLDAADARGERIVAVAHAATLRAALVLALGAPASAFWRIDIAPLCRLRLRGRAGQWTLVSLTP